jgi:hypothetical protein
MMMSFFLSLYHTNIHVSYLFKLKFFTILTKVLLDWDINPGYNSRRANPIAPTPKFLNSLSKTNICDIDFLFSDKLKEFN